MSTRMTRGSEPGTGTSRAHISGTWPKPSWRAATAGNSASRSSVSVNRQLTTSSGTSSLRFMISRISHSVAPRMASAVLRSTVIAPRRAKSLIRERIMAGRPSLVRPDRCGPGGRRPIDRAMAHSAARRVLVPGLLAGCLALLPFLRDDLGAAGAFLPSCLTAIVLCNLATSALLLGQFLTRGSAPLLGLAGAYLAASLLAVVHLLVLPGALSDGGVLGASAQ